MNLKTSAGAVAICLISVVPEARAVPMDVRVGFVGSHVD